MSRICKSMRKFVQTPIELEHESQMRLLKTQSHTSERRAYETDKDCQVKRKDRRPIRKGQKKRHGKPPPYHLEGGAGRKRVDGRAKNRSSATTAARGDEANYTIEKKKKNHTVLCHIRSGKSTQNAPGPEGGMICRTKKERTRKLAVPRPNLAARLPRPCLLYTSPSPRD